MMNTQEWDKIAEGLKSIDPVLEKFLTLKAVMLSKNTHDSPDRLLSWIDQSGLKKRIQIFAKSDENDAFCVWACTFTDTNKQGNGFTRFWKNKYFAEHMSKNELSKLNVDFFIEAYEEVTSWQMSDLEEVS